MKKTLLVALASLAIGTISSQAQAVYSQNVVGYVNQKFLGGGRFNLVCNPLSGTTNSAEQLITSMQGNENIYIWDKVNGGFYIYAYLGQNSGLTYNWVDAGNDPIPNANADGSVPPPQIPPGTAFFYTCDSVQTNTFTGSVLNTNATSIAGGGKFNFVGSALPIGGDITSTNLNLPLQANDNVYVWDAVNGGFFIYAYLGANSGLTYDWVDAGTDPIPNANADGSVPPPNLTVGQGIFYTTTSTTNWVQVFNSN